jgi:hypothetical protein
MALVSPGVQVTIVDESQYLSGAVNSVPFILLATAANKTNPNNPGTVAVGTIPANANNLTLVTSQQDLISTFGNPFFYNTTNGTPINGYELNEYGLLAAYYALGLTNSAYILRADIDLTSLIGSVGRPEGNPANGAWWLNTTSSTWGLYEFDQVTGTFNLQSPIVINSDDYSSYVTAGVPNASLGTVGDYAVIATDINGTPTASNGQQFFYKNLSNQWVALGSKQWLQSVPAVTGTESNPTLTAGNSFYINLNSVAPSTSGEQLITVPSSPNNTVYGLANAINTLNWGGLSAQVINGQLNLFSTQPNEPYGGYWLTVAAHTGTVLSDIGIAAGSYFQPSFVYGTSAQQPLWQASQSSPAPSGSVWLKVGSAGNGLLPTVSQWSSASLKWINKPVTLATSDWVADSLLDSTGGSAIPLNTVYAQYGYDGETNQGPVYLWSKSATGATVATGSVTDPTFSFTSGETANIYVSVPSSQSLDGPYTMNLAAVTNATSFATQWYASGVPYTSVSVNSSGAIVLSHTQGGVIIVDDTNYTTGYSLGLMTTAGFVAGTTTNVKYGPAALPAFYPAQSSTTGSGTGFVGEVQNYYGQYIVNPLNFRNAGSGYAVGDTITFNGTELGGAHTANDLVVKVTSVGSGVVESIQYVSGTPANIYTTQISNWVALTPTYTASLGAPNVAPANGQLWYYSDPTQVDIMVNTSTGWKGYGNSNYDSNGFPTSGSNNTDPNGPIISATAPTTQSTGHALVYGDIWIDTSDLVNYPLVNRWQSYNGMDQWVLLSNTDSINSSGIIFEDARWATNGDTNPATDPIPTIQSLLTSNYLDLDAPKASLYPVGMLLWNTRRSGFNVKAYEVNYFNANSFPDQDLPTQADAWVTQSGNQENGAPYMGAYAQRAMVVKSLRAAIETNQDIRDEDNYFNLQACPNYCELQPDMVTLNTDRGDTSYILGDTPMTLPNDATAIQAWATNAANAPSTSIQGCVTRDTYLGLFYPSGLSVDLSGNQVAVPPSHMMLSTFLYNDQVAYPWLAAAGTRRGIITNASSIGYVNAQTGAYVSIKTSQGIRDVLYTNNINPLVFFTGQGLLNYGNITSFESNSSLDRTNVARLIAYIRRQLTLAARPFVFEPNDSVTQKAIAGVIQSLFVDLVAKRGIYDYLVVCDKSNNTPARIDANELWVDCAIEPVKAAEFIYIPVRILATGTLGNNAG